jgi:hypothetical protein
MTYAIMLDARLGNVLPKEAGELKSFLVENDKMRSKRFDLLLLCSAVYQSGIVANGDGKNENCLFLIDESTKNKSIPTRLVPMPNENP